LFCLSIGFSVADVYCQKDWASSEFRNGKGPGINRIPDGGLVNCEHTWPQSRFNGNEDPEAQVSDLHHLFPTDNKMNGSRANFEFANVDKKSAPELKCAGNYQGAALVPAGMQVPAANISYEVPDAQKGNTARALFYFAVRYRTTMSDLEERYMREWNKLDPVDDAERSVNDQIQEFQGSRNPFVDFPELVDGSGAVVRVLTDIKQACANLNYGGGGKQYPVYSCFE
jgi:hypothetical protein